MTFANEITISDVTSTVSIILVILGGIFGYYQWRKSVLLKRAGYINDLIEKIRTDEYIKDVVYMFDYNKRNPLNRAARTVEWNVSPKKGKI